MWPFTESTTIPEPLAELEPVPVPPVDPRAVLLAEFRCVERELAKLSREFLDLHKKYFRTNERASFVVAKTFSERDNILAQEKRIFDRRDQLVPARNRILRELARLKLASEGRVLEVLL